VDPLDVLFEFFIADLAAAGLTIELVVVGRGGDLDTEFDEPGADRLDTPRQAISALPAALMVSDEPTD